MSDAVEVVSLLGEPVRRRLYEYVVAQADPVSREGAATAVGIKRPLAAFHLDSSPRKACSMWSIDGCRAKGVRGPVDRPSSTSDRRRRSRSRSPIASTSSWHACSRRHWTRTVMEHHRCAPSPDRLAERWVRKPRNARGAAKEPRTSPGPPRRSWRITASSLSMTRMAASDCATAPSTLSRSSYTGLVCGMNVEIMQAMVEELGLERFKARLEPQPGMCCVAFRRT